MIFFLLLLLERVILLIFKFLIGSYAKVVLVKKIDNGKIYALKILKKKYIERKKQEEHIITERNVLVEMDHPFIIKLAYSF